MTFRTAVLFQLAIVVASVFLSTWFYFHLPDVVPTHWNAAGKIDSYGRKWMPLILMPATILFLTVLHVALPSLSPKSFEVTNSGKTYHSVMLLCNGLMLAMHLVILEATANVQFSIERWIWVVMWLFIALIGNLMGKVKRNFYMGIRTPWTLADETVWTETHRRAAKQWFFVGIFGTFAALVGVPFWLHVVLLTVICIWPIALSYSIYKKRVR